MNSNKNSVVVSMLVYSKETVLAQVPIPCESSKHSVRKRELETIGQSESETY
jgi:hypothetical protein